MLAFAKCRRCKFPLPLGPGLLGFRTPPPEIECRSCGSTTLATLPHRCTWMGWLLWKSALLGCPILCLGMWLIAGEVTFVDLTILTGVAMFAIILGGGPLAILLAIPAQLAVEKIRPILRSQSGTPGPADLLADEDFLAHGAALGPDAADA